MTGRCPRCGGNHELVQGERRVLLHALPQLKSPVEIVDPLQCANCGCEVRSTIRLAATNKRIVRSGPSPGQPAAERKLANITAFGDGSYTYLSYPCTFVPGKPVLFPAHEGTLGSGHPIDRHGDPDLMAEFSAEYLKQYWAIVPQGRLPSSLSEMAPALHLLVNAAELAMKAGLIRSDKSSGGHSLAELYGALDCEYRREIECRYVQTDLILDLRSLGVDGPTVQSVLGVYGMSFGDSSVYQDTRYFAEPTMRLKSKSLKGGNLVKTIPYPIFLPVVVQMMLDVHAYFSGAERLKRLGAEVSYGSRDPGNDQHGDWSLVPSSVGLVVIRFAQLVARDERGDFRDAYSRFKEARPPLYSTSWMYGGNVLLFYRAGEAHPEDGETVIDGLECKVWHDGKLGMHPRDLYLLADVLEAPGKLHEFQWVGERGRPEN